jgi:nucleotide-binding universal stress UspA family protein
MPVKSVLSIVGVNHSDNDVRTVIDICSQVSAHLSVLVVAMAPPPPANEYGAVLSDTWMSERDRDSMRLKSRVEQVEALVAKADLSADVDSEYTEIAWADETIGQRARYADLTILGPELLDDGALKLRAVNGGLFESGRPLLVVPTGSKPTLTPKVVLLAWDSRIEAARAAREAIDLMSSADSVHVTLIDPQATHTGNGPEPGADIAAYLARHGCKVTVDRLPSSGYTVAEALRQHAVDISADLVVMGAYGHSRLRERIFGGVTKSMIDEAALPILMAR